MCFAISTGTCVGDEFILGGRLWGKTREERASEARAAPCSSSHPMMVLNENLLSTTCWVKGGRGAVDGKGWGKRGR